MTALLIGIGLIVLVAAGLWALWKIGKAIDAYNKVDEPDYKEE